MNKVYIVIPAYNEEKSISKVLTDLIKKGYKNIVVVDDGSKDGTEKMVKKHDVFYLKHIINRGQGAALKTGIDFAIQQGADIIVTFDADGQFLCDDIKRVILPVLKKEVDIVLGSRFLGKAVNIGFMKKLFLKLGVYVVYILYRIKVTDSQSGFRALSKHAAEKINITSDRMDHAGEILWEIKKKELKYSEVPITVIYDDYSIRKGQRWHDGLKIGFKMLLKRVIR